MLDFATTADTAAVRSASLRLKIALTLATHPDKTGAIGAQQAFVLVTTAAHMFVDDSKRMRYAQDLATSIHDTKQAAEADATDTSAKQLCKRAFAEAVRLVPADGFVMSHPYGCGTASCVLTVLIATARRMTTRFRRRHLLATHTIVRDPPRAQTNVPHTVGLLSDIVWHCCPLIYVHCNPDIRMQASCLLSLRGSSQMKRAHTPARDAPATATRYTPRRTSYTTGRSGSA